MSTLPSRLLWNAMCGSPSSPDQTGSSSSAARELVMRVVLPFTGLATKRSRAPDAALENTSGPRRPGNVARADSGPATGRIAAAQRALTPHAVHTDPLMSSPSLPEDDSAIAFLRP